MPMCLITNGSKTEQHKQFTGCILHYKSDPMILKEIEIWVGLGPGRGMVSSETAMVYITSSGKRLRGTETYFAYFRDLGS